MSYHQLSLSFFYIPSTGHFIQSKQRNVTKHDVTKDQFSFVF